MYCFARNTLIAAVAVVLSFNWVNAQFAPVADLPGTTAIPADSSVFVEWATAGIIRRGYMNIADTTLGYASAGADSEAIGASDGRIVSLGDGGVATLTFNKPIYNGAGFDFAVFENGFMLNDSNLAFLELAFVEVSSDGVHFVRFPAISNTQDTLQLSNASGIDGSQLNNLAGKYVARYGTPFDLDDLVDSPNIDLNNITYVRVIDVVGSIDSLYATYDSRGNIINDPWPTPFASCGFDLDAVGVINAKNSSAINDLKVEGAVVYPNPVKQGHTVFINADGPFNKVELYDLSGRVIQQFNSEDLPISKSAGISTVALSAGVYFIQANTFDSVFISKLIVE